MPLIYLLLIYFLLGGSCLYLLFCADPHGRGPLSVLRKLVFKRCPNAFEKCGQVFLGRKILWYFGRFVNYICFKNHPLIQVFYVIVAVGGFILYVRFGFMEFFPSKASSLHIFTGSSLYLACLFVYYKVCTVSPGIITSNNLQPLLKKYKYDEIIFTEGELCRTCFYESGLLVQSIVEFVTCVLQNLITIVSGIEYLLRLTLFYKHAYRVKQCVGEKNYKWFLLYIGSHSLLCSYGMFVGLSIFMQIISEDNLLSRTFRDEKTGETVSSSWWVVAQYLFFAYAQFSFVTILCSVMGFTLLIFTIYHLSMVSEGRTTNESVKIGEICARADRLKKKISNQLNSKNISEEDKNDLLRKLELCEQDLEKIKNYGQKGLWNNLKIIFAER